jgi:hypothetical protein
MKRQVIVLAGTVWILIVMVVGGGGDPCGGAHARYGQD